LDFSDAPPSNVFDDAGRLWHDRRPDTTTLIADNPYTSGDLGLRQPQRVDPGGP